MSVCGIARAVGGVCMACMCTVTEGGLLGCLAMAGPSALLHDASAKPSPVSRSIWVQAGLPIDKRDCEVHELSIRLRVGYITITWLPYGCNMIESSVTGREHVSRRSTQDVVAQETPSKDTILVGVYRKLLTKEDHDDLCV